MRLLSRLLVIFVVCLGAISLPAEPVQATGAYITLSPRYGVPGTKVTVRGFNFTAVTWVDIFYCLTTPCLTAARKWVAEKRTDARGSFTVTFTVPESYTGAHSVRAYIDNRLRAAEDFTVRPGLAVSPRNGPVGTNVTVVGRGFARNETNIELRYYLNGNHTAIARNIRANAVGSWQKSFNIPASARGRHRIDAWGTNNTLRAVEDAFFTVTPGISLDKPSGSPGKNITMTGTGFYARERDVRILFAGRAVRTEIRADDTGYWQGSFEVPEMPKGAYNVTAEGERTRPRDISALSFAIKPGLVLSPDEGHVGMNLTVAGRGFAANKNVVIKYDGSRVETAETNNRGSFEVRFVVPESQHGGRRVAAEGVAGNATAIFTMESDSPDAPELVSPSDKSRVGFIGEVRPTFSWREVSDPSGVRYRLQIATSARTTATGEFVDHIVSILGIAGANYTLNATQALPYGKYYWIVQAVDRAGNAGNWTAPHSFRAGLLPLWAFIAAIVAIAALSGALGYFFVIRRRIYY